jgi:hypothetical protein
MVLALMKHGSDGATVSMPARDGVTILGDAGDLDWLRQPDRLSGPVAW